MVEHLHQQVQNRKNVHCQPLFNCPLRRIFQFKEVFYLLNQILQNKHCQPLFNFYWKVLMHVTMIIDQFMDALLIFDVWAKCGYNKG